jgi:hypothetical protein
MLTYAEEVQVQRQEHAKDLKLSAKQQDMKAKMEKRARDKVSELHTTFILFIYACVVYICI